MYIHTSSTASQCQHVSHRPKRYVCGQQPEQQQQQHGHDTIIAANREVAAAAAAAPWEGCGVGALSLYSVVVFVCVVDLDDLVGDDGSNEGWVLVCVCGYERHDVGDGRVMMCRRW